MNYLFSKYYEVSDEYKIQSMTPKYILTHSHTMTPFDTPGKQAF